MQFNHLGFKTDLIRLLSQKEAVSVGMAGEGQVGVKDSSVRCSVLSVV